MKNLLGMERDALRGLVQSFGEPAYRGEQLYRWIYTRGACGFEQMSNLPRGFRSRLADKVRLSLPSVEKERLSQDGSRKYLLRLACGDAVEAVSMPSESHTTLCISSQAGCAMGCRFCATASMGLRKHLSAGDIVGQVLCLKKEILSQHDAPPKRLNILFMGMGEPLDNYDAVMQAFRLLNDPEGLCISHTRITVSTVGLVPAIERFAREPARPNLSVSLNAVTDELRSALMPIARKYPLPVLLAALESYPRKRHGALTLEYVLLKGVNDSSDSAKGLRAIARRLKAKVNLIAFNPAESLPFDCPSEEAVARFQAKVYDGHFPVTLRRPRGRDIEGACGQLCLEHRAAANPSAVSPPLP